MLDHAGRRKTQSHYDTPKSRSLTAIRKMRGWVRDDKMGMERTRWVAFANSGPAVTWTHSRIIGNCSTTELFSCTPLRMQSNGYTDVVSALFASKSRSLTAVRKMRGWVRDDNVGTEKTRLGCLRELRAGGMTTVRRHAGPISGLRWSRSDS
jgi:hypothetical protein